MKRSEDDDRSNNCHASMNQSSQHDNVAQTTRTHGVQNKQEEEQQQTLHSLFGALADEKVQSMLSSFQTSSPIHANQSNVFPIRPENVTATEQAERPQTKGGGEETSQADPYYDRRDSNDDSTKMGFRHMPEPVSASISANSDRMSAETSCTSLPITAESVMMRTSQQLSAAYAYDAGGTAPKPGHHRLPVQQRKNTSPQEHPKTSRGTTMGEILTGEEGVRESLGGTTVAFSTTTAPFRSRQEYSIAGSGRGEPHQQQGSGSGAHKQGVEEQESMAQRSFLQPQVATNSKSPCDPGTGAAQHAQTSPNSSAASSGLLPPLKQQQVNDFQKLLELFILERLVELRKSTSSDRGTSVLNDPNLRQQASEYALAKVIYLVMTQQPQQATNKRQKPNPSSGTSLAGTRKVGSLPVYSSEQQQQQQQGNSLFVDTAPGLPSTIVPRQNVSSSEYYDHTKEPTCVGIECSSSTEVRVSVPLSITEGRRGEASVQTLPQSHGAPPIPQERDHDIFYHADADSDEVLVGPSFSSSSETDEHSLDASVKNLRDEHHPKGCNKGTALSQTAHVRRGAG